MVDEFDDGNRGGTASAETQEEKEEVEVLNDRCRGKLPFESFHVCHCL